MIVQIENMKKTGRAKNICNKCENSSCESVNVDLISCSICSNFVRDVKTCKLEK